MKYKAIIGQQHIKEHFQSAVVNKTISHAYIINGEKFSGKEFIANTKNNAYIKFINIQISCFCWDYDYGLR